MVKSVLGVNHQGLRDWAVQRISAIVMSVYILMLIGFILAHRPLIFSDWHHFFKYNGIKVFTLLFILSILFHAWVGIWTVFTDYIKSYVLRATLNTLVILSLIACFFWALLILWSF